MRCVELFGEFEHEICKTEEDKFVMFEAYETLMEVIIM